MRDRPDQPDSDLGTDPGSSHRQFLVFEGRHDQPAEENIRSFIDGMRRTSTVFGSDLVFDHDVWDITHHVRRRASDKRVRLRFFELDPDESGRWRPLSEPFAAFTKALIRYFHGTHPSKQPQHRLRALLALYQALVERTGTCDPIRISTADLDAAAQHLSDTHLAGSVHRYGSMLVRTADFLDKHGLCVARLAWKNPFKAISSVDRVGPEFDALRLKRLPSRAALEAIAKAYWA